MFLSTSNYLQNPHNSSPSHSRSKLEKVLSPAVEYKLKSMRSKFSPTAIPSAYLNIDSFKKTPNIKSDARIQHLDLATPEFLPVCTLYSPHGREIPRHLRLAILVQSIRQLTIGEARPRLAASSFGPSSLFSMAVTEVAKVYANNDGIAELLSCCTPLEPEDFYDAETGYPLINYTIVSGNQELTRILKVYGAKIASKKELVQVQRKLYSDASSGNLEAVLESLKIPGVDIHYVDTNTHHMTALMGAASKGNLAVVNVLFNFPGINVNQTDHGFRTALIWAARSGHVDVVEALLKFPGIDVNKADLYGNTPLIWAIREGHINVAKALLSFPEVKVNKTDQFGNTALILLAGTDPERLATSGEDYIDVFNAILKLSELDDVNKASRTGDTGLMLAAVKGNLAFVEALLKFPGIDANKAAPSGEKTALIWASVHDQLDTVRALLDFSGIEINKPNRFKKTALDSARTDAMCTLLRTYGGKFYTELHGDI